MADRASLKQFTGRLRISDPNTVFLITLFMFFADNIANFLADVPVFAAYSLVLLPLLWFQLWTEQKLNRFIIVSAVIFIATFVVTNLMYGFNKRNVADVVYILLFITSFYYYDLHRHKIRADVVHIFLIVIMLLFSFAFAGVNSMSFNQNKKIKDSIELNSSKKINHDQDALDILEYNRDYNYGLFRIPHVATYFLGFLGLFYGFLFMKKRHWYWLALSMLLFVLMIFTGVRTFAAALLLALVIYFIRRKTILGFVSLLIAALLLILFRFKIFFLTQDTILEPFTSLVITIVDNFDRLSRALIWKSWLLEMRQFGFVDFLIGKSFYQSVMANLENLHRPLWFHNDFFSIIFSYGILALVIYAVFFIKIYRRYAADLRSAVFPFLFFFTMPFAAFINGMYYYFPVLLLFVYFVIIKKMDPVKV